MAQELPFIEGTVGKLLTVYLVKETGQALDLTGATVTLVVQGQDARSMTVASASAGQVTYTTTTADNATDGTGWTSNGGPNKDGRYAFRIHAVNGSTYTYNSDPLAYIVVSRA